MWQVGAAVWAAVVLLTGLLPTQSTVHTVSGGHDGIATTLGHFAAYALLGFLLGGALAHRAPQGRLMLLAWVLAVALGALVEVVQGPLPYRDAQVVDVVVNAAGAAAGLLVFSGASRVTRSRSHHG
jgi:VanZ family protein